MDSIKIIPHAPYKIVEPRIKVETPIGAIEVDSGNHVMDGVMIVAVILSLYACKKVFDRYFKK